MNFARDVVGAAPPGRLAIVELARDGTRREWRFGEVAEQAALLHARLEALGARRGDVVLTLLGNRPEWVLTMVACFRAGYAVLPCTEQLRPKDLRLRLDVTGAALVVADERNRDALEAAGWDGPTLWAPWGELPAGDAPPPAELDARDPCLVAFTSGTSGEPKAVLHGQGYLPGQRLQAEHWLAAEPGDLVWCTAASGWSKSARNAFIAPWLRGAAALLHDARFDPGERLDIAEREGVDVLCMAPTEYRVIANRAQPRRIPSLRGWSPPARRSTQTCSAPGTRRPGSGSATATGRPRPATSPATRRARRRGRARWAVRSRRPAHRRGRRAHARPRHGPDVLPALPRRVAALRALAHGRPRAGRRGRLPVLRSRAPTT